MSRTTIRLEDDLEQCVATAADRAWKTPNAFILDAIAQSGDAAEVDDDFNHVADERCTNVLATGECVSWEDARVWLKARARGEQVPRPVARKLDR
jgi:predicted transcriptional regulator